LREETASLSKVKEWARKYLPSENELRDTILSEERETLPRWELLVKLDVYSRTLDSKARRMTETG
jgi:hypothetical protein